MQERITDAYVVRVVVLRDWLYISNKKPFKRNYSAIESILTKSDNGVEDGTAEPRNDPRPAREEYPA